MDTISVHGRIRERVRNIIKIFKLTPKYDFVYAAGCADYGFLPILIGVFTARINKKNILVDFHSGYPEVFMRRFAKLIELVIGDIPVTVASAYLFDIFKKCKFNVFLIPHHFHYESFPPRTKQFSWNKKIIWTGSFQFMYDPETALKACEEVLKKRNDIEFHFFGQGPLLNSLKARYNNPNIIFEGFVPRNEMLEKYQDYCIFLNTSFGDNFPLRLVEAAFYELLVICAKYGGPPTIYCEKECLFFEKGNHTVLSGIILNVLDNAQQYDSFRKNMHEKVLSFKWDNIKEKWLKLLNDK